MERLVEIKVVKFNVLSIHDCYYRLFPLIYISYDSEGITIQGPARPTVPAGSCEDRKILVTTTIPRDSFESYEFRGKPMVLAILHHARDLGGKCLSISILNIDSWRVKNVFRSSNGVSYEVISSYMYKLSPHPSMDSPISFERYPAAKKCLKGLDVEVSVKDVGPGALCGGIATFRREIFCISTFTIGKPGEPYCTIPSKCLKLLNKFLGTTINTSKIEFCKSKDDYLFLVDIQYYTDIRLT